MEPQTRIELVLSRWQRDVLPLNYCDIWCPRWDLNPQTPAPKADGYANSPTRTKPPSSTSLQSVG